jgi:GIY-YIG catalytic domain-containing protein
MSQNKTVSAKGASGTNYTFYVYPWGTDLKPIGGVYMVLRKPSSNGNYDILYVGQTSDLSERFDNHHKKPCFDRNRKTHISAMVESSEQRRLAIESDLLGNRNTTCNG